MQLFTMTVKPLLIEKGLWNEKSPDRSSQRAADKEVADTLRRSFQSYEKTAKKKPDVNVSYFVL